jgi:redox-sensitive bicupin YhaK (pirin superfamily)
MDETARNAGGGILARIAGRTRDLGGFTVRRILPAPERRMVGPFIFFDHMGPADFPPGQGIDVRPHPHIGLATVTYLFEGSILHRDSLGFVQPIEPGAVNWMTAGRGIVHSERTSPEARAQPSQLHGIQSWVALPIGHEDDAPSFHHHPAATLPDLAGDGWRMRLIAGAAFGAEAPVAVLSPMFYLDASLSDGARLLLPADLGERAVYVVDGAITIDGQPVAAGEMAVLADGRPAALTAAAAARAMLLGGQPLAGERHIWWNFVASSEARIDRAKAAWAADAFGRVPGEDERIPLPDL